MGGVLSSVKYTPDSLPYHSFDDFRGMKKIDNGGYGTVFIAYAALKGFTRKKQTVAIKCFNAINVYSEREIDILKTRTHPNIVQLFGVIWDGEFVDKNTPRKIPKYTGYVMEYMELGSLHRVIHDLSEEYDVELITTWIKQIATGLQYLHENGIIHRDVKPQNILLAARDHIKLADFGLARNNSAQNTNTYGLIGTGAYRAPEIVSSRDYGPSADIYSLGVTIWEIVTRQEPRGIFDMEGISNELSKLIKKCLKQKVSDRPSINEVIESVLPKTILLVNYRSMAVLSADRSKWTQLQLRIPIFAWRSIYLNEEIYIIGGDNDSSLYKLDKNLEWILLSDMNIGRMFITNSCLEWNGYIWIFGGRDNHFELLKSVERYDPKANKWTLMPDMIHPRVEAAATVWNDRIIVYGGLTRNDAGELYMTNTAECFNPKDGTWTELPSMPKPLCGLSLVSYKNKIIVMDVMKKEDESHSCVYELDLLEENPTWKPLPPMKYPAFFLGGIVFNDEIYAIGGRQLLDRKNEYRDRVEIFNGEQWRDGPQLPFRWSYGMSAIIIPQHLADRLCNYKPE